MKKLRRPFSKVGRLCLKVGENLIISEWGVTMFQEKVLLQTKILEDLSNQTSV